VTDNNGKILREETMIMEELGIGNNIVGVFAMDIGGFSEAQKLKFEVSIAGTGFRNQWDLWVYPEAGKTDPGEIYITYNLDKKSEDILKDGGSVLLLTFGKLGQNKGAGVAIGFSSIFWNTAWTRNQPPHTLGILCDPDHPVFNGFPTEYHTNWQWWDPVTHSQAMILDNFPAEIKPLIQPIDTWFENRRLALAFESLTGGGKLLVCSIDLRDLTEGRKVSKRLFSSVIDYMNSDNFNPDIDLDSDQIEELIR